MAPEVLMKLFGMQRDLGDFFFENNSVPMTFSKINSSFESDDTVLGREWSSHYSRACDDESAEIAREVPTLYSGSIMGKLSEDGRSCSLAPVREEAIDFLHFWMSFAMVCGLTPEEAVRGTMDELSIQTGCVETDVTDLGGLFRAHRDVLSNLGFRAHTIKVWTKDTAGPVSPYVSEVSSFVTSLAANVAKLMVMFPPISFGMRLSDSMKNDVKKTLCQCFSCWIFLAISLGMSSKDIEMIYQMKHSKNIKRQQSGAYMGSGSEHDAAHGL